MHQHGLVRVTAVSLPTQVAHPSANRLEHERLLTDHSNSDIVLFPELSLSGYTCGELFAQDTLLAQCIEDLATLTRFTTGRKQLIVVGLPIRVANKLLNCAAVLNDGRLLGIVPKQYLPSYQEFYEGRWFRPGDLTLPEQIDLPQLGIVPLGVDLLFQAGETVVGIEICEDLWVPMPPSSIQALAGANVLLNLSASNELIGKAPYRLQLIASQSGRCCAAYAYASSGPSESTTDLVFSGHCVVAENGTVLGESARVGTGLSPSKSSIATADIDVQRLMHDRQVMGTFLQGSSYLRDLEFRRIRFEVEPHGGSTIRVISGQPFVPADSHELDVRCQEIFEIQRAGLAKRVQRLPSDLPLVIGVSGGLDSTLALLVACWTCRALGWPTTRIHGITMPGFGTSMQTRENAWSLMKHLGVTRSIVDIRPAAMQIFRDMNHAPLGIEVGSKAPEVLQAELQKVPIARRHDLVFENVQARVRTLQLMSRGFVLGTGDLSESALGWSTYNGDHMSMYNVNASVPKALVKFLIRYIADHEFEGEVRDILHAIVEAPITPELLPLGHDEAVVQDTEETIGPYELHDFFLYYMVRTGAKPAKILFLAQHATFSRPYPDDEVRATLRIFLQRFFHNQFKRSCVPDGPKVGSVSLSPRGDWRMPSDAEVQAWLDDLNGS